MARDFAAAYKDLAWEAVFCSPLKRAVATAQPLCDAVGLSPQLRDGLKEIAYGQWEGKTPEEVNREFHDEYVSWLADPGWFGPTGGERGVDIARRSSMVLDEIERTHPEGNILWYPTKPRRALCCAPCWASMWAVIAIASAWQWPR